MLILACGRMQTKPEFRRIRQPDAIRHGKPFSNHLLSQTRELQILTVGTVSSRAKSVEQACVEDITHVERKEVRINTT